MSDFLLIVDSYEPTIPYEITRYHLKKAGVPEGDERIANNFIVCALVGKQTTFSKILKAFQKIKRTVPGLRT